MQKRIGRTSPVTRRALEGAGIGPAAMKMLDTLPGQMLRTRTDLNPQHQEDTPWHQRSTF
jgi:hypothetical protein